MGCFSCCSSKTSSSTTKPSTNTAPPTTISEAMLSCHEEPRRNINHQTLLSIPQCRVHLVDGGDAAELGGGEFSVTRIVDDGVPLATIVRVSGGGGGEQLTWPLTKDEPVVRVDALSYLFTLPMSGGDPLSYGVSFPEWCGGAAQLAALDELLRENSCFSGLAAAAAAAAGKSGGGVDWKEFAPRVEDYNNVLARAIAGGTGQIVKGIFKCSNAYANQVQKGGEMTLTRGVNVTKTQGNNTAVGSANKSTSLNKSLKRVRKLSKTTEKLSKTMLNGVGIATGAVMAPMIKSQAGKSFLAMVPGEVLLASLDAVNKILDAAEVAEKQAFSATSTAATRMVSNRFGENAGEATADVLATAGHCAGTAWNVFKIRKALNPASSVSTGVLKNAAKSSTKV